MNPNQQSNALKLMTAEDWQPFDDVYFAFAEANPMLGLNPSESAAQRLRQQYGQALLAAGAAQRLPNRRWLASTRRFGPALFQAMTRRRRDILAATGPAPAADASGAESPRAPTGDAAEHDEREALAAPGAST